MKIKREPTKLEKRARKGDRGHPLATVAFYGPDHTRASKVVVGIIPTETSGVTELEKWFSDVADLRRDPQTSAEILEFITEHSVKTVAMSPGIIGCPHEEGADYPAGEVCPRCPYWASRDRWTGEELPEQ